jgi:hypothetical protein
MCGNRKSSGKASAVLNHNFIINAEGDQSLIIKIRENQRSITHSTTIPNTQKVTLKQRKRFLRVGRDNKLLSMKNPCNLL